MTDNTTTWFEAGRGTDISPFFKMAEKLQV
jgi:hypothetical protein